MAEHDGRGPEEQYGEMIMTKNEPEFSEAFKSKGTECEVTGTFHYYVDGKCEYCCRVIPKW